MTHARVATAPISTALVAAMPGLRRFARALTGDQGSGDRYALAALETLMVEPGLVNGASSPRIALLKAFHDIWSTTGQPSGGPRPFSGNPADQRASAGLAALDPVSRAALLLATLDALPIPDVAEVLSMAPEEAAQRVARAHEFVAQSVGGRVLIIEDEPIIAMNLEMLAADAGHHVTGIARTRGRAVELGMQQRPDLILADIQLADRSSGIDAAADLVDMFGDIPVIFITAYPERLLTGARREPVFLIAKPFEEAQVETAMAQALFFSRESRATAA